MVRYRDRVVGIERVKARDLAPHPSNWRTDPRAQTAALRGILDEVGIAGALLAYRRKGEEKLTLIDGHLRAGTRPNQEWPVVVLDVTDEEAKYLLATHDPLAAMAQANQDRLLDLLASVDAKSQAVKDMLEALANGETQPLLNPVDDAEPRIDEAEELRAKWGVERGQIWTLGEHRLMCGDATAGADVRSLMKRELAQMTFTDPPYGVDYDGGAKKRDRLRNDEVGSRIYIESLVHLRFAADDQAPLYLWYADGHAAAAAAAGYQIVAQIIWAKNHAQFVSSAHYHGKHEACYYGHRKGYPARWHGPDNEVTLWEYDRSPSNDWHPTQKPIELAERAIINSSILGQIVLDPFLGGGSSLIAAERTGRRCYAMEIEPKYVAVSLQRWADATGKTPVLA